MINKENGEWAPVPEFLIIPDFVRDIQKVTDAGRGRYFSNFMMALAVLKNYKPYKAPPSLTLYDLLKKFDKTFGLSRNAKEKYGCGTNDGRRAPSTVSSSARSFASRTASASGCALR